MTTNKNSPTPGALRAAYEIMSNRRLPLFKHEAEEIADLIDRETGASAMLSALKDLQVSALAMQSLLHLSPALDQSAIHASLVNAESARSTAEGHTPVKAQTDGTPIVLTERQALVICSNSNKRYLMANAALAHALTNLLKMHEDGDVTMVELNEARAALAQNKSA